VLLKSVPKRGMVPKRDARETMPGRKHPQPGTMDKNLMHQTLQPNAEKKITKEQIQQIEKASNNGELNKGKQKIK